MHKILAVGCSHTDYSFKSQHHPELDTSWPKWPELFADKLGDAICKNIGKCGIGNNTILKNALYESSLNDYDILLVLWTEITRIDIFDSSTINPCHSIRNEDHNFDRKNEKVCWMQEGLTKNFYKLEPSVDSFFKNLVILQEYCRARSIKLVHGMAGTPYGRKPGTKYDIISNKILDVALEYQILLDNSLIGYPFVDKVVGTNMLAEAFKRIGREKTIISELDLHFSAAGQEIIADIFYEKFKATY
jgi:hypothetical protein